MKKYLYIYLVTIVALFNFTSCLEAGLDDLPTYSETEIKAINFEYRWSVPENENDPWAGEKLQVKTLATKATIKDGIIECEITIPAASGTFTEEERSKVTLKKLNAYVTISPGASIKPVGNTPILGKLGDFSQAEMVYEVIAADGKNKQNWKLIINKFSK